jgi:tetratricopeptide (TPR) repeat protein
MSGISGDGAMTDLAQYFAQALQHYRQGRRGEAESLCRRILAASPDQPQALHLLGAIAVDAGRPADALSALSRAAAAPSRDPAPLQLLATAYLQLGRYAEALAAAEAAIARKPDFAEAYFMLAMALTGAGRRDAAITAFETALRLKPSLRPARHNLAGLLALQDRVPEAAAQYQAALRQDPSDVIAHHELSLLLLRQRRAAEALPHLETAVRLQPDLLRARHNLGSALCAAGRWQDAVDHSAETVRRAPQDAEGHHNLAVLLLLLGRLEEGWPHFEARWELDAVRPFRRPFRQPSWRGQDLSGRTLLVHDEQGFGDTLQLCRYLKLIAPHCRRLIFETRPELLTVMRNSFPLDGLEIRGRTAAYPGVADLPDSDFHAPLMSLPGILGTRLDTIPAAIPYLRATPAKIDAWAARLSGLARPLVGLVWAGQPVNVKDRERSIALARLAPLAQIAGVSFLSLQTGAAAEQAAAPPPGMTLYTVGGELHEFDDTAAVLHAVDLVITVDTATAHLAGAIGKPVWLLNRYISDWRWLLARDDSPWYPTMRIFRQPSWGDWDNVLVQVAEALAAYVATRARNA